MVGKGWDGKETRIARGAQVFFQPEASSETGIGRVADGEKVAGKV
jgi:hypothetical protein